MKQFLINNFIAREIAKKGVLFLLMAYFIVDTKYSNYTLSVKQEELEQKQVESDSLNFVRQIGCEREKQDLLENQLAESTQAIRESNRVLTLISK